MPILANQHGRLHSNLQMSQPHDKIERRSLPSDAEKEGVPPQSSPNHEGAQSHGGSSPNRRSSRSHAIAIQPPTRPPSRRVSSSFPFDVPRARVLSPTAFDGSSLANFHPQRGNPVEPGSGRNSPSRAIDSLDDAGHNHTPRHSEHERNRSSGQMHTANSVPRSQLNDQVGKSRQLSPVATGRRSHGSQQDRLRQAQVMRSAFSRDRHSEGIGHPRSPPSHGQTPTSASPAGHSNGDDTHSTQHATYAPSSPVESQKSTSAATEHNESFRTANSNSRQLARPPNLRRVQDRLTMLVSRSRFERSSRIKAGKKHEVPESDLIGTSRMRPVNHSEKLHQHGHRSPKNKALTTKDSPRSTNGWSTETLESSKAGISLSPKSRPFTASTRLSRSSSWPTVSTLTDVFSPRRDLGSVSLPRRDEAHAQPRASPPSSAAQPHESQQRDSGSRPGRGTPTQTLGRDFHGIGPGNAGAPRPPRPHDARLVPSPLSPLPKFSGGSIAPLVPFTIGFPDELAEVRPAAKTKKRSSGFDTL